MTTRDGRAWPALATMLALLSAGCDSGDDTACDVVLLDDAELFISCPDGTTERVPACFAGLPDLNGDRTVDWADCPLIGTGALMRAMCTQSGAWLRSPACRAVRLPSGTVDLGTDALSIIVNGGNEDPTVAAVALEGSLTPTIVEAADANRDGNLDENEVSRYKPGGYLELTAIASGGGDLFVAFGRAVHSVLYVDHGDHVVEEQDLRPIDDVRIQDLDYRGDSLAGLISTDEGRLSLWIDTSHDLAPQGAEEHLVVEQTSSARMLVDQRGEVDVAYFDQYTGGAWLWRDTNLNLAVDEALEEIPDCSPTDVLPGNPRSVVVCEAAYDSWIYPGPDRPLGLYAPTFAHGTQVVALSGDPSHSTLWVDLDYDLAVGSEETADLTEEGFAGQLLAAGVALVPGGVAILIDPGFVNFLGELCDLEADTCAGGLECRVSGLTAEPRCVPPL